MFHSVDHHPCVMNKFSVVSVPNGHSLGVTHYGASFKYVPLASGNLDLRDNVEQEAYNAGWRYRFESGEKVWTAPPKRAHYCIQCPDDSGTVGDFVFVRGDDDVRRPVSPVFPGLTELFAWMRKYGWRSLPGTVLECERA